VFLSEELPEDWTKRTVWTLWQKVSGEDGVALVKVTGEMEAGKRL